MRNSKKLRKPILPLIATLFIPSNVFSQNGTLLYLYLGDKNGNVIEIPFIDGMVTVTNEVISIDMSSITMEFDYHEIAKFYFKNKGHLILSDLVVSQGELTPEFNSHIFDYVVNVPYNTPSVTITGTASQPNATVTGNGLKELAVGANPFTITVTEEGNETTLNYTVTVNNVAGATISDNNTNADVKIYPNPTTGRFTVYVPNGLSISIHNMQGQKIEDKTISSEYTDLDIAHYPAGIYLLRIITKFGQTITTKLIKR
jgi:hypothetical protein